MAGEMKWANPWRLTLPDKDHYLYDRSMERPIEERLIKNYILNGVMQPVIVCMEGEKLVVVCGRDRVRYLREANNILEEEGKIPFKIPYVIRRGKKKDLFGAFVSENNCRRDIDPLTKAQLAEECRIKYGATIDEVATYFNVSEATVHNWRCIMELDEQVIFLIEEGKLGFTAALALHGLSPEEQIKKATAAIEAAGKEGKKPTRASVKAVVDPNKIKPPTRKLIDRFIERKPKAVSNDFLRGMQWARGIISDKEAGVDRALVELKRSEGVKPAKKRGGK